jgi:hypothetical protein
MNLLAILKILCRKEHFSQHLCEGSMKIQDLLYVKDLAHLFFAKNFFDTQNLLLYVKLTFVRKTT